MDITSKIRKLLAKAENAGTPEEAQIYNDKATELMLKHQIEEAELGDPEGTQKIEVFSVVVTGYAKQKAALMVGIAQAFSCQVVRTYGLGGGANRLTVYGWASDLESVKTLYASLEVQAERQAATAFANHKHLYDWAAENGRSFKTSFYHGFAQQVYTRLLQQRRAAQQGVSTGTALALVDRSKAVKQHMAQENPNLKKASPSRTTSRDGFRSGRVAGDQADLGMGNRLGDALRTALR